MMRSGEQQQEQAQRPEYEDRVEGHESDADRSGHGAPRGHRRDVEFNEAEMRNHRSLLIKEEP